MARSLTSALLAALVVIPVTGCGKPSQPAPATSVPSETVSAACWKAMQDELEATLYKPDAERSRLPECESESEEAIGLAAERLLREAADRPSSSSSSSPAASPTS